MIQQFNLLRVEGILDDRNTADHNERPSLAGKMFLNHLGCFLVHSLAAHDTIFPGVSVVFVKEIVKISKKGVGVQLNHLLPVLIRGHAGEGATAGGDEGVKIHVFDSLSCFHYIRSRVSFNQFHRTKCSLLPNGEGARHRFRHRRPLSTPSRLS